MRRKQTDEKYGNPPKILIFTSFTLVEAIFGMFEPNSMFILFERRNIDVANFAARYVLKTINITVLFS